MFPVLFSIGNFTVSSFGFFLALSFLIGLFLVWRLARAWDLEEERVLDLILLTIVGGLIGARLYFVTNHFDFFTKDLIRIFFIPKYPGFSFWGGFLGGWLSLYYFARRFKMDFWHIADLGSIGLLSGLVFSNLGCFFGGCSVGAPSKIFFAVNMAGEVGKRFPVQIIESLLLLILLLNLWKKATHFHPRGRIISLSLMNIGLIKLLTSFFKPANVEELIFSLTLTILGIFIFYRTMSGVDPKSRRTPLTDLKSVLRFSAGIITSKQTRQSLLFTLAKSWYNQKTAFNWKLSSIKKFLRRIRVKSTG